MLLQFIVLLVIAVAGSAIAFSVFPDVSRQRRDAVWRTLAQRRDGQCNEPKGRRELAAPPESIDFRVAQAGVRLDLMRRSSDDPNFYFTRARSRYTLGAGPVFEVSPAGITSGLAFQDLALGDAAFDRAFVVRGRDHAGVKAAWTVATQQLLIQRLPSATVWSDGTDVRLTLAGALEDPARLDAVLDVVGALASVGAAELHAFALLPEAKLVPASGTWDNPSAPKLLVATERVEATATLHWAKGGPCVWLTLPTSRDLPPFQVVVRNGAADGLPTGLLSEYVRRLLGPLDGALLLSEPGKLDVRWLGIPTPDGLMVGAKLLGELAGGTHHVGAFR
ncbi:MAG: hypothetical protein IPH72_05790 [Sandaracinaceae bacterium]|nr:hypothetical protein [Sandaracinaceae bacterium]